MKLTRIVAIALRKVDQWHGLKAQREESESKSNSSLEVHIEIGNQNQHRAVRSGERERRGNDEAGMVRG